MCVHATWMVSSESLEIFRIVLVDSSTAPRVKGFLEEQVIVGRTMNELRCIVNSFGRCCFLGLINQLAPLLTILMFATQLLRAHASKAEVGARLSEG